MTEARCGEGGEILRITDEEGRLGGGHLAGLLRDAEPLVDQHEDVAGPGHAVVEPGVVSAVVRDDGDAVTRDGPDTHPASACTWRSNSANVVGVPSGATLASWSGTASAADDTRSWMRSIGAEVIAAEG